MLLHRLWIEYLVKDARQLFLGLFAGMVVAVTGACNPRQERNKHTEIADQLSARERNSVWSGLMRLAQEFKEKDASGRHAVRKDLHLLANVSLPFMNGNRDDILSKKSAGLDRPLEF